MPHRESNELSGQKTSKPHSEKEYLTLSTQQLIHMYQATADATDLVLMLTVWALLTFPLVLASANNALLECCQPEICPGHRCGWLPGVCRRNETRGGWWCFCQIQTDQRGQTSDPAEPRKRGPWGSAYYSKITAHQITDQQRQLSTRSYYVWQQRLKHFPIWILPFLKMKFVNKKCKEKVIASSFPVYRSSTLNVISVPLDWSNGQILWIAVESICHGGVVQWGWCPFHSDCD